MKTELSKKWNEAANLYSKMAADRVADAYEYEINVPSIQKLIPKNKDSKVLDVGCGSGDFVPILSKYFENIEGTDVSPNMVLNAKNAYPKNNFFVWDLEEEFASEKKYDVIVCKLVLMFIEDLNNVANEFKKILNSNGSAIISVVHPVYWLTSYLLDQNNIVSRSEFRVMEKGYYSTGEKIIKAIGGNPDLQIGFVHRTLADYIKPFTEVGLVLTGIEEPKLTEEFVQSNPIFEDRINIPMRLNYRVEKK